MRANPPPVYAYDEMKIHKDEQGNEGYYQKFRNSFSEYIERCIDAASK